MDRSATNAESEDSAAQAPGTKIAVTYTGGTIGCVGDPLAPLTAEDFEQAFDEIIVPVLKAQYPDLVISYIPFQPPLDSTNLQPSDWCRMAKNILQEYGDRDAFVVLHGTDTMAYSASALSFLFTGLEKDGSQNAVLSKPIVFTGSQLPLFDQKTKEAPLTLRFDTDAYQNICGAVSACYSGLPEVCLFFDDTLFRGNRTEKVSASSFAAFATPNYPALGTAGVEFYLDNENVLPLPTTSAISLESENARNILAEQLEHITRKIDQVSVMPFLAFPAPYNCAVTPTTSVLADLLTACVEQGLEGLVLEAYGEGNFPSGDPENPSHGAIFQALNSAHEKGIALIDNTQVMSGIVDATAYAAGSWLAQVGAIGAYDMTSIASVAKLIYLLTLRDYHDNDWELSTVEQLMQTNLTGEIMDVNRLDTRGKLYLSAGEFITAFDGSAELINDPDRGPVLKNIGDGSELWSALETSPSDNMPGRLYMQSDGNLVFYDSSNTALWDSGTTTASESTSMVILDSCSGQPGSIRLYIDNYARGYVSKTLYPPKWSDPLVLSDLFPQAIGKLVSFTALHQAKSTQYVQITDSKGGFVNFTNMDGETCQFLIWGSGREVGFTLNGAGFFTLQEGYSIQFGTNGPQPSDFLVSNPANFFIDNETYGGQAMIASKNVSGGEDSNNLSFVIQWYEYEG